MPIGGFNEPIWHQNWKEARQLPENNPSEFVSLRDLWIILGILVGSVVVSLGSVALIYWLTGRPFPWG